MRRIASAVALANAIASCAGQTALANSVTNVHSFTVPETTSESQISISVITSEVQYLKNLSFALSKRAPADVDLGAAYTAYTAGAWTISGKIFANRHRIHKGSMHMHKISEGEKFVEV